MKPVYVALINYNGWRDTIECLESLLRSDRAAVRVLVVDNGSADDSLSRLRGWAAGDAAPASSRAEALVHLSSPPVPKPVRDTVITRADLEAGADIDWDHVRVAWVDGGANLGFSGGNNVAIRYALRREADAFLLLLNNDTVIAPNAISEMVAFAERDAATGVVGATLMQYYAPDRVETYGGATVRVWNGMSSLIGWGSPVSAPHPQQVRMDFVSGCCMLIPNRALRRVGLLDERFFLYSEDADWGLRAGYQGLRLIHCPSAHVWHKAGGTAVHRSEFHDYHTVKSVLHFVRKHRPSSFPLAFAYMAGRMLLPKLLRRQWGRLRAAGRGVRDYFREARGTRAAGAGRAPAVESAASA